MVVCPLQRARSLLFALLISLAGLQAPDAAARILPSADARTPAPELPRIPGLPADAELERSGARIGEIHLNTRQLFDVNHADENTSLSRAANRLHVPTRDATIEDQLL